MYCDRGQAVLMLPSTFVPTPLCPEFFFLFPFLEFNESDGRNRERQGGISPMVHALPAFCLPARLGRPTPPEPFHSCFPFHVMDSLCVG